MLPLQVRPSGCSSTLRWLSGRTHPSRPGRSKATAPVRDPLDVAVAAASSAAAGVGSNRGLLVSWSHWGEWLWVSPVGAIIGGGVLVGSYSLLTWNEGRALEESRSLDRLFGGEVRQAALSRHVCVCVVFVDVRWCPCGGVDMCFVDTWHLGG